MESALATTDCRLIHKRPLIFSINTQQKFFFLAVGSNVSDMTGSDYGFSLLIAVDTLQDYPSG